MPVVVMDQNKDDVQLGTICEQRRLVKLRLGAISHGLASTPCGPDRGLFYISGQPDIYLEPKLPDSEACQGSGCLEESMASLKEGTPARRGTGPRQAKKT